MYKTLFSKVMLIVGLLIIMPTSSLYAQQTVFSEDFNAPGTPQNATFTSAGQIGSSNWSVTQGGTGDFGAKIDDGILTLSNDISAAANDVGWVLASVSTSNYGALYKSILSQNVGVVSWTFNMRQKRANPSGLSANRYGSAFILAGTPNTSLSAGKGYAIVLGQTTKIDPIRLITYSSGLSSGTVTKITSSTTGLNDFGAEYTSIRVEYNPAGNKWSLYLRKDNATSFQDPNSTALVYQDEVVSTDFVNEALTISGGYWNANTAKAQTAFFDNFSVKVETPQLISLNPDSKVANSGAFSLAVNGVGFLPTSKVYWNGSIRTTTYVSPTQLSASILATDLSAAGTAQITVQNGTFISNALPFTIESAGVPVLTLSATSLTALTTSAGTASTASSIYTISGVNLTAGATVTAPENFEVSLDGLTYADVLTLPITSGTGNLTGQPLSLRVRIKATALPGTYSGNVIHTTPGAISKSVAVSGRVFATEPTANATAVSFTNITSTGFKVNWVNGNGAQRLVLIKTLTAVSSLPTDGITYDANASFAGGSQIGSENFVVYKGTGNSVQITGLEPSKAYHISVIEFNGSNSTENYATTGAIGNTTTLNSPVGLQVLAANTSHKIDFDATVDGVNLGTYQGVGISQDAEVGQLDSDSWAFSGFSGGNIAFGGNSVEDSNNENGASDGNVDDNGLYAFNVGTAQNENYTLGIQPGGTDFNPGTITLRMQNQMGAAMTSVNVGYKIYVYNDQPSSTKIAFSYSAAPTSGFVEQSVVELNSPTTADLAPGWKAYYRVVTISGLNIASNNYYYFRWSGSSVPTTGLKDEFAIDDIEVIANPTSNTVAFEGIAEDFVLQGNATLSANLTVQNRLLFNGGKLAIKDKTLTIAGSLINTTANGLTGSANSNLVVTGIANPTLRLDQTTLGTTNSLNSLSLIGANANIVTVQDNVFVNQLLKVDAMHTLNLGTTTLSGTLNTIQNNGTIRTQNTTTTPFPAGKTWAGTGILNLNATSTAQTLVAGTYSNLTLSSTGGTNAVANVSVNGILSLPNGNPTASRGSLSMSTFTLTMGENGTNTGLGDVTGIIKRNSFVNNKLYTFGHPNTSITFTPAGTLPTTMSAKLAIGAVPTWRTGATQRFFDIIQTGGASTKAIIRQHYLDSELNGNIESKLVNWGYKSADASSFEQGRSNINTVDNWVEISNANVAQIFVSTFNNVFITLDETEATVLTWNGSVSDSWTTSDNWSPIGTPSSITKVIIPNVAGLPNQPLLNPIVDLGSIVIETGGILNAPADAQFTIFGGAGAWQNNGTFNPGTGTSAVLFNNLDATIAGSTTFNNVSILANAGLRALDGNFMSIAGALTNNGTMFTTLTPNTIEFKGTNQIIPAPGGIDFGGYHNLIVTGTGATIASTTLNVRGNLTLNQSVPFTGKTINLAGLSDQTIAGTAAINFDNLIVNKESGKVLLAKDVAVDGILTLTSGNLVLGTSNLTLGQNPVAGTFNANNMIVAEGTGLLKRTFTATGSYLFPIGDLTGSANYSPITVNVTAGSFAGANVGVSVIDAKHPNNFSSQNYISRYWNVVQTGITGAVATITGTYDPTDLVGAESEITSAQLKGTFDAITNSWLKFSALSSNTLVATNATLAAGQNSSFTGLKAGVFSVEVFGYGSFCQNATAELHAITTEGDGPFTYMWSNSLPNTALVTIPTATVGSTNYTLTVRDANGFVAMDNTSPVIINPLSVGGTIANASQQICAGTLASTLQLNGSVGSVVYWQKSTDLNFATFENLSNFSTTLTGLEIGAINQTTYIRAAIKSGSCEEVFSSVATILIKSTTWNGNSWNNGAPDAATSAIFTGNYTATGNVLACSITVSNDAEVLIPSTFDVTINGAVTVESGTFTLSSDSNLIQLTDAVNSGQVIVNRKSASLFRLDYTMWGSPVFGTQTLKNFSPLTVSNRFYTYNSLSDQFAVIDPLTNGFTPGKGYLIRMPDNHSATVASSYNGTFTGTPNNGPITLPLAETGLGFNMIANPYASMINADTFIADNATEISGTLYFWRRRNAVQDASAYYATYTSAGGTGTAGSDSAPTQIPNGFIQVGQGFIVKKIDGGTGNIAFNNPMRTAANNANQFFKNATTQDKSRIWLNVTNAAGIFGQTLIAYMPSAANGVESSDGKYLGDGATALTSWLNNEEYIIQGRAPFTASDVVPLHFKNTTAGNYTIAIDHVDGLFEGNQDIYLRDNFTGILHDLKATPYTFVSEVGSYNARFEIVYFNVLSVDNPVFDANAVVLYKKENNIVVNAGNTTLDQVEVYDISGRVLAVAKKINANEVSIHVGQTNQVLIVKITSTDGRVVNKKTIN